MLLGLFVTLYGTLSQLQSDAVSTRLIAISGYVVLLLVILWIGFINKKANPLLRKISLPVFFGLSPLFFIWIGTWIVKAPLDPFIHPIERSAYSIYDYSGSANPEGSGSGYLTVSNSFLLNRASTKFTLDYTVPEVASYAGFVIHFEQPVDLSGYKGLKLVVQFKDAQSRVKLTLRDASKNSDAVILGDGQFGDAAQVQAQEFDIPLEIFRRVVYALVQEIEFSVDGAITTGSHSVSVSNIRLAK
jgi:hypothetical protein